MRSDWTFTSIWEEIARKFPDAPALAHGERTISWSEFNRRANGVAGWLYAAGIRAGANVAQYLYNEPAYIESLFACFKLGTSPINTNYRYTEGELLHLWRDADVGAVVFHEAFTSECAVLRDQMPEIKSWLCVGGRGSSSGAGPSWADDYEAACAWSAPPRRTPSGDDLFLLYTGGTTGLPKGVLWRQDDLVKMIESPSKWSLAEFNSVEELVAGISKSGPRMLTAAPLMHGTALWISMSALNHAGSVITLEERHFDAASTLSVASDRRANSMCVVGDVFARPIVEELQRDASLYDLSALRVILSSGVMFSADVKGALSRFIANLTIVDTLGSSESGAIARSTVRSNGGGGTSRFVANEHVRVIGEDGRDVAPGSGQSGRLAVTGYIPLGYHKDPEKTAATFLHIDGSRYVVAGDWAVVEDDGSITLLGRGSSCINTGGEKVFPEEVEEVIKGLSSVIDVAVVGVPDQRFGSAVVALVETKRGASTSVEEVTTFVRRHLAGYKTPRQVYFVESLERAPNGKLDHRKIRTRAIELGSRSEL